MDPGLQGTSTWEPGFEEIFDLSLDLLCIAGFDGYFKRVNFAFEEAFGYTSAELMSRPFLDLVDPEDRPQAAEAFERLIGGEEVLRFENRNICADGSTLWLEWSGRPMLDERVFYGAARIARHIPLLNEAISSVLRYAQKGSDPLVMLTALANGVGEEVFFRGALFAAIGNRHPVLASTAIYTLAATATRNPALMLASGTMGALFGLQRRATGGIQAPVLTHLTWSTLMLRFLPALVDDPPPVR